MTETEKFRQALDADGVAWELDGNENTHKWLTIVKRGPKWYEAFESEGTLFLSCEWDEELDAEQAAKLLSFELGKDYDASAPRCFYYDPDTNHCGCFAFDTSERDAAEQREKELRELCGSLYEFASELVRAAELRGSRDATRHRARLNAIGDVLAGMGAM